MEVTSFVPGDDPYTLTVKHGVLEDCELVYDLCTMLKSIGNGVNTNLGIYYRWNNIEYLDGWHSIDFIMGTLANNNVISFTYDQQHRRGYVNGVFEGSKASSNHNALRLDANLGSGTKGEIRYIFSSSMVLSDEDRLIIESQFTYACVNSMNPSTDCCTGAIVLSTSITIIEKGAFQDCTALQRVIIPSNVVSISSQAFERCAQLVTVRIPQSMVHIDDRSFADCFALETPVLPSSLTLIGNETFYGCSSMEGDITIPVNVQSIGNRSFYGCAGLRRIIVLSEAMTSIGMEAFGSSSVGPCDSASAMLLVPVGLQSVVSSSVLYSCTLGTTGCVNQSHPSSACCTRGFNMAGHLRMCHYLRVLFI